MIMGGILWNEWGYFFVFFVICFFSLIEFYNLMIQNGHRPLKLLGIIVGIAIYAISFLHSKSILDEKFYLFIPVLFILIFIFKLYEPHEKHPFENIALSLLGVVYIALPFSVLNIAVFINGIYSYQVILGTFFIIWMNDISAYFIGSRYGKHRLFERISPKKSWEGSIGGAVFSAIIVFMLSFYLQDLELWQWTGIAVIVIIAGTHGDLIESMLKRSMSIKDSSNAIPGHGGFLDRFDQLLIALPFIVVFLKIF